MSVIKNDKMIKNYNLFLESFSDVETFKRSILAHDGWVEINPPEKKHWALQLEYLIDKNHLHQKIENPIKLTLLGLLYNGDKRINYVYYLGDDLHYINSYTDNYTNLPYGSSDNYNRMIKICEYLSPYFYKKPSDETINFIEECFIEISDIVEFVENNWGYTNGREYGYFPAFRFHDKLALSLHYDRYEGDFKNIEDEFEYCKERLKTELGLKCELKDDEYNNQLIILITDF